MRAVDVEFIQAFGRLTDDGVQKGWHERNGGNMTYRLTQTDVASVRECFRASDTWVSTQVRVPNLAGEFFLVTGTGKYLRNVRRAPQDNLAIAELDATGEHYRVVWGLEKGGGPTSEFPSHLMNLSIKKAQSDRYRVMYHAHPVNTVALTFVLPLEDAAFTREIWGMMTECPVIFPEGIGIVPWMVPGGWAIAEATGEKMKQYDIVIWAHHGMFCAGADFDQAFGLMETVEKSAEICVKVLSMGGKKRAITSQNFRDLAAEFSVPLREDFLE